MPNPTEQVRILEMVDSGFSPGMSEEDIKQVYKDSALGYDEGVEAKGYVAVAIATKKLVQALRATNFTKEPHIMDMGAGTGKVGELLKDNGFKNVDALDISQEMLDIAKEKGLYRRLICDSLSEKPLSIEDGAYDAVISVGVFTVGHVKPCGFDQVARITRPGGLIVFTVRGDAYADSDLGYKDKIESLAKDRVWQILEHEKIDYVLHYKIEECRTGHLFLCQKL